MAQKDDYASIAAKDCLKIQPKEQVLLFADGQKLQFAEDLAGAVKSAGGVPSVFYISAFIKPVEEVTVPQAISLVSADVVIYVLEAEES
jgi:leucyl aminopeptidase (aminopeptidase T)